MTDELSFKKVAYAWMAIGYGMAVVVVFLHIFNYNVYNIALAVIIWTIVLFIPFTQTWQKIFLRRGRN